ncbi:MAG: STAS/SEC14 domain-containing protein [Hyphomonadaceae bacterium]
MGTAQHMAGRAVAAGCGGAYVRLIVNANGRNQMIEPLGDFPANVIAFQCHGHITRADYDAILVPAVEAALKKHDKIRLFYKIGGDFSGITPGAMWEDFSVGMAHLLRWERIAVVTDVAWIGNAIRAFAFLMPGLVRVYPLAEETAARSWIAA